MKNLVLALAASATILSGSVVAESADWRNRMAHQRGVEAVIWAMPALQRRVGVNGSLMLLPLSLFGGALFLAASTSAIAREGLRVAEGGLKSSIHRSNWEQAFLPIRRPRRLVVKVLVDGLGTRMAEGLASTMLLVWLNVLVDQHSPDTLNLAWVPYLIAGATLGWIFLTVGLRRNVRSDMGDESAYLPPTPDLPPADCCAVTKALAEQIRQPKAG